MKTISCRFRRLCSEVRRAGALLLFLGSVMAITRHAVAVEATLAHDGIAKMDVVVSANADDKTRAVAAVLADYLGKISGAQFKVATGDGQAGIAVGRGSDFPALAIDGEFAPQQPFRREEYLLRSTEKGVLLIGATPAATEHAVWDLLYRLGYRQFFPGPHWEIVPHSPALKIDVDSFEKPDFYTRRIWYGFGLWGYNDQPYADWCTRNRAVRGFGLSTGHVYQNIIKQNQQVFKEHPEYLALINGKRQTEFSEKSKFCLSNIDLRQFIINQYVFPYFRDNPQSDCVSLEPSDGGDWCECEKCTAMGSISDRVLTLANEAADAVNKVYPGKYVGFLAYYLHCPPPTVRVHPNVLVKIQTSFITGNYTFEQLTKAWQEKGAVIGVGDYYSVFQWDGSRPATEKQKGSDLYQIRTSIPQFHQLGARFLMVESSDLWGAIGLGHYIAARLAWHVDEAKQVDALVDDFLEKSFGPAKMSMEGFYRLIYRFDEKDRRPLIRRDMLARMYRYLAEARTLTAGDAQINARLDDLLLFTHYEELYQIYEEASGEKRQQAAEALVRHAYRMRKTMMVHSKPIVEHLIRRDGGLAKPSPASIEVEHPFDALELSRMLADGIANTELARVSFQPFSFSDDLVPAAPLKLPDVARGNYGNGAPAGQQKFYTWLGVPGELQLRVTGGLIVQNRHLASNVQTRLYAEANPILGEAIASDTSVEPDGIEKKITLHSSYGGLLRVEVRQPANRAKVDTAEANTSWTMDAGMDDVNVLTGPWSLYFYVPKGTKVVGGFASDKSGMVIDGAGKTVFSFSQIQTPGYFEIPVPEGQDGKLWKFERCSGKRLLLTVPPYLARTGKELLLPREVVKADSAR